MLKYCKTCPDKDFEECALPTKAERVLYIGKVVGAYTVDAIAKSCLLLGRAKVLPDDSMGIISATSATKDIAYSPAEACAWLHMLNDTNPTNQPKITEQDDVS